MGYAVFPILILLALCAFMARKKKKEQEMSSMPDTYPFREDVERRLPDGTITTDGYAAMHPKEFAHWRVGYDLMGVRIEYKDWKAWYNSYYELD